MTAEPQLPHRPQNESPLRSWESTPPQNVESQLRFRLSELEVENLRLNRLVSELLIKNQQLRELLCQ